MRIEFDSIEELKEFIEEYGIVPSNQSNKILTETVEAVEEKRDNSCFREYGKIWSIPTFTNVYPNGKIALKRGVAENYDIHTIIELKKLIPLTDEYPKFSDLKKAVKSKADQVTIKRACYVIEHGGAEYIINKWNNMSPKYDEYGRVI